MKIRLDKLLLDRGLAPSRERAQAMVLAGRVLVDGQKVTKAGHNVSADSELRILGDEQKYVGRGGIKLEHALAHWQLDLTGRICMDVGASTGGFTDCMLQHGAAQVIAVDTGYGQIDARFRTDPRVRLMEKTNARHLIAAQVPEPVSFIAMDVSFISATLVLPAVLEAAFKGRAGDLVVLVKPQFEAGREHVGKGGIVREHAARQAAVERVRKCVDSLGGIGTHVIASPILGAEGNQEFLLLARFAPR
ncbi:MAG: TlyA family RNA methyltransferase [Acidobacteriales bacterium]|nr:TlyA family RNA methyltransferase [Terriglobales bacterium]